MISQWTQHLKTDEEKQRFKNSVLSSRPVLERLQEMINTREAQMVDKELDITTYDSHGWDYRQAHNNGYKACLRALKIILTLDPKDKK
jgi:hypothetical protein